MTRATCPETPDVTTPAKVGIYNNIQAKHAFLVMSLAFLAFTLILHLRLHLKHLFNYSIPVEQRQIIRIISAIPIYAAASVLQIAFYSASQYIKPLPDLYEAFALASFFLLMVAYVTPEENEAIRLHTFDSMQRTVNKKGKTASCGGLYRKCRLAVFQYCIVAFVLTVVELITEARGTFCEDSNSFKYAHIWVTIIHFVSVVTAVVGLLRFYKGMKPRIAEKGALHKFIALKLVVLITVVQGLVFNFLVDGDHLKPSNKLSYGDISIGIPALFMSIEMALFAIWFQFAYSPSPYVKPRGMKSSRGFGFAVADSLNPKDLLGGIMGVFGVRGQKNTKVAMMDNSEESVPFSPTAHNSHPGSQSIGLQVQNADYSRVSVASSAAQYNSRQDLERGDAPAPTYTVPYEPYRGAQ